MKPADLQATIAPNYTPNTVLRTFQAIEQWSTWYPGVVNAGWISGEAWQIGAVMEVQVRNSLGMLVKSRAVVLPVQESYQDARLLCWENRAPGLVTICYAWAEPTDGGCRFTLQKEYRGALVPLLWLMKGRQARMLEQALENLSAQVYCDERG